MQPDPEKPQGRWLSHHRIITINVDIPQSRSPGVMIDLLSHISSTKLPLDDIAATIRSSLSTLSDKKASLQEAFTEV